MSKIAIFDLDLTITKQATWTRFLIFVNGARPAFWLRFLHIIAQGAAYKIGLASRDSVKVVSLRALSHLSREELEAKSAAFIARELDGRLRPGAVAAIRWHQENGHRLVIATASVDLVADELGRALGFDDVIATRLDWTQDGASRPPRLLGNNCYGAEKLRRFEESGIVNPGYAYSDHITDLAMLQMAEHGIAVNPSAGLRKAAQKTGMTIADLNTDDISFLTNEPTK
ncbi:HAD-IB family hydrolase [Hyphomonas sp. WL0036]|uniref:HAD family hydrolase n=1 Tax=Hyphomonas sediminis TaxID=2866160 RepID=UPI001C7FBF18|nr:HAD-IB family hydrolase [Hyphomonas sediminis]